MMKKILLIEDDQVMRENTAEILELANYQVATAVNGALGCSLAREFFPDLIICDIMMPELDGYATLHNLSLDPETASIPFIFLTAKAEKSEARKGIELGADDYITKPFEDVDLLKAIEARLKRADSLKKSFVRSSEGLNSFLEQAGGISDLQQLSKNSLVLHFKKKEIVFNEGDIPEFLYFLNSGKIKSFKMHQEGKEYIIGLAVSGEFFGHKDLFENKPYTHTCVALENSEICKIPKEDFLALLYKNRDVANQFIKMLSNKLDGQEKQLLRLAYDSVRKRTADVISNYTEWDKSLQVDTSSIRITREDLAKIVGTSTESIIRCLSDLKEDNLIDIKGREIIILNRKGLVDIQ